jgi:hypothetical protein
MMRGGECNRPSLFPLHQHMRKTALGVADSDSKLGCEKYGARDARTEGAHCAAGVLRNAQLLHTAPDEAALGEANQPPLQT